MRAVTCTDGTLSVTELPAPGPGKGQVLLDVVRCGICGSDLHARHHADAQADVLAEAGYDGFMRSHQQVVLGHEFLGRVAGYGPGCDEKVRPGTPVVAVPLVRHDGGTHAIGLSTSAPGAYAEQVVAQEALLFPVPNGLSPDLAALTEPMAVAHHAVRRGDVDKGTVAIVVGCGPVGLSVICMLKARGVEAVVASDYSPGRRALASACGADVVVDPAEGSPFTAAGDRGHVTSITAAAEMGIATTKKLRRRFPRGWHHVWRTAERLGAGPKHPVVFECVGAPGVLDDLITRAPLFSRVVVVGVCMTPDTIRPVMAINKEVDLRFVVGYTPLEFRDTLHLLADGKVHAVPLVTGTVGLAGVAAAFDALATPEAHAKVLIDPTRSEDDQSVVPVQLR